MLTLPEIETERLRLRHLTVEDACDFHTLETDPDVKQFLEGPSTLSVQDYQNSIARGATGLALAVTLKTTGQFLGRCGFTIYVEFLDPIGWEINVVLGRQCPKRQGYATEVAFALIPNAFTTLTCDTILGVADAANIASLRLCDKLRMKHERDTIRYGRAARIYTIKKPA